MEDEEEDEMPKSNDRKRVKDRIIEGIAKAVKHIQSYQLSQTAGEEQGIVLRNSDWQFHKLVENLDHAFLYGLRHFTSGYWVVVQEFTHKSTIEDVTKMSNVVTNLGRSRAWLYLALSDHLLESFIHCFMKNAELVRKHYVKEALVLDEQRLELLLTLSSGLELITFDLEVDVKYLDLCSCVKLRTESQEEEIDDNLSLCSMISAQSQNSSMEETNRSRVPLSPLSILSSLIKPLSFKQQPTFPLTLEETEEEKKLRIETFANAEVVPVVMSTDDSTVDVGVNGEVEVVHVKPKRHRARKRDHLQKSPSVPESDNSSLVSVDSIACLLSPISSESSGYQTVTEDCGGSQSVDCNSTVRGSNFFSSSGETVIQKNNLQGVGLSDKSPDETKLFAKDELSQDERLLRILEDHLDPLPVAKVCLNDMIEWKSCSEFSMEQKDKLSPVMSSPSLETRNSELISSPSKTPEQSYVNNEADSKLIVEAEEKSADAVIITRVEEPSIYDKSPKCSAPNENPVEVENNSVKSQDDELSKTDPVLPSSVELSEKSNQSFAVSTSPASSSVALSEEENQSFAISSNPVPLNESNASQRINENMSPKQTDNFLTMSHPSEIEVDNNLKVVLMLDVFCCDEVNLFKMFRTCQGHTEGQIVVTYVVITSHHLYLLKPSNLPNKFIREVAIPYKELDYVSVSLNCQVLHIVCRARHNQFWITTGDEVLTRIIVSHLSYAVSTSSDDVTPASASPSLTVLEDATAQKISIAKLVSEEMGIAREDVYLLNYSLVYWEDSEAIRNGGVRLSHGHQGFLFYKVYTATYLFVNTSWHQGYFVLEQGVLHQYANRKCSGSPQRSISLTSDQCLGCRRVAATDRHNVFEILLPQGSCIELSASSEAEVQEWLARLCQATCDQSNPRAVFGCMACCSVLSQSHVFMCHEDLQTNFLRSLACLSLQTVTQIQTDAIAPTYCVLVSRRQVKPSPAEELSCIYFSSTAERDKFIGSILCAWCQLKKSDLGVVPVDAKLSKRCRDGIAKLAQLHKGGLA